MWPFKSKAPTTRSVAARAAAVTLFETADADDLATKYPTFSSERLSELAGLLCFTRVAIILQWLNVYQRKAATVSSWLDIEREFQEVVYSTDPAISTQQKLAISTLTELCRRLPRIMERLTQTDSPEAWREFHAWWDEWLLPIGNSQDLVEEMGTSFAFLLTMGIYQDTPLLGEFVMEVGKTVALT